MYAGYPLEGLWMLDLVAFGHLVIVLFVFLLVS